MTRNQGKESHNAFLTDQRPQGVRDQSPTGSGRDAHGHNYTVYWARRANAEGA